MKRIVTLIVAIVVAVGAVWALNTFIFAEPGQQCETKRASWGRWGGVTITLCENAHGNMKVISIKDGDTELPPPAGPSFGYPFVIHTDVGYLYATGSVEQNNYAERYGVWPVHAEWIYHDGKIGPKFSSVEYLTIENLVKGSCIKDKDGHVSVCMGSGRPLYLGRRHENGKTVTFVVFGDRQYGPFDGIVGPPSLVNADGEKVPTFIFAEQQRNDRVFRVTGDNREHIPWPEIEK